MTETAASPSTALERSAVRDRGPVVDSAAAAARGTWERAFSPLHDGPSPDQNVVENFDTFVSGIVAMCSLPGDLADAVVAGATSAVTPPGMGVPAANVLSTLHIGLPHIHIAPTGPLPGVGAAALVGAVNVLVGGANALRSGDVGFAPTCLGSPVFEVRTGSSSVFIGGKRAARAADFTKQCPMPGPDPAAAGQAAASAGRVARAFAACSRALTILGIGTGATQAAAHVSRAIDAATSDEASGDEQVELVEAELAQAVAGVAQAAGDLALVPLTAMVGAVPTLGGTGAGMLLPIPTSLRPVLIGGLPMPSWSEVAELAGAFMRALRRRRPGAAHPDANGTAASDGHPIGLFEGNVFDDFVDASLAGLVFGRHYDTRARHRESAVGRGHRHTLDRQLRVWLHRCEYVDERGVVIAFPAFRGRREVSCVGRVLRRTGPTTYEVRHRGEVMSFAARDGEREARLESIEARGRRIVLVHRHDGVLRRIVVADDAFELEHDDAARIVAIRDARGALLVGYAYDRAGCLVAAQGADRHEERFAYDGDGRLVEWRDKRGYRFTWRYDAEGRCIFSTGADGQWRTQVEYLGGKRRVTRGSGHVFVHHFDPRGLVTRIEREDGGFVSRQPDVDGRIVREIDAAGREVRWVYDDAGAHVGRVDRFGHLLPPSDEPGGPSPFAREQPATLVPQMGFRADAAWHDEPARVPSSLASLAAWALPPARGGGAWSTEHDGFGRVARQVDPRGHAVTYRRDAAGNVVESVDRDGRATRFETVGWNLVGAVVDPLGHRIELRYTPVEGVASYRDANENVTEYQRDRAERVTRIVRNGVLREEYVFDAGDRLIEKRDAEGRPILRVTPHANALPGAIELASGGRIELDYDTRGRHTRASTTAHDVRLARDDAGAITLDQRDGRGVRRWRAAEEETAVLFGRFVTRVEARGATTIVRDPTGRAHTFDAAERGRLTRSLANGTREILAFDEEGRLEGRLCHRLASDGAQRAWAVRYERSAEGDLRSLWDSIRGPRRFEIDAAHRLAAETAPDGSRAGYVLDAANNVVEKPGLARAAIARGNVLLETDRETFEHDARGRLSCRRGRGREAHYTYDSLDQLVRVDDGADEPWTATYDGLGRRCRFGRGARATELFWDGDRIAAELGPDGALRVHVYASATALIPFMFVDYDSVDAEPESARSFFVFHDASGMPVQIEDETGRTVWWVDHVDPFGALEIREGAELDYRLRWPGHYADPECGLHYNRFRDYDPTLARYLQPDPIGHAGSPQSLYAYLPNPLVAVDLEGLQHPDARRTSAAEEGEGARPLVERPPESPDAVRVRHGLEWAVDPIRRAFDAALTMCGLSPDEVERRGRLPPEPGEARPIMRWRRYLAERAGRPAATFAAWAEAAFRVNVSRDTSSPHERAAVAALGGVSNNGADPKMYTYHEWAGGNGRSMGSLRGSRTRPEGAREHPRIAMIRPDGIRGRDVIEHKHLTGRETTLHDSPQLRAEAEMARRRRGRRLLVLTSDGGMTGDPPTPRVRPSAAVAAKGAVHYYDTTSGQITFTWDRRRDGWGPASRRP